MTCRCAGGGASSGWEEPGHLGEVGGGGGSSDGDVVLSQFGHEVLVR